MPRIPKILIAYDGSDCADKALSDLKRAGLNPQSEVRVLTVSDTWYPTVEAMSIATDVVLGSAYVLSQVQEKVALKKSLNLAVKAAKRILKDFPGWKVTPMSVMNTPASGILKMAEKWKPSLIVLGSQGHHVLNRLLLGSVSYKVLTHSTCNVRIVRSTLYGETLPSRVLVAVDGSKDADIMVKRLAARFWGKETEFRVVVVTDYRLSFIRDYRFSSTPRAGGNFPQRIAEAAALTLAEGGFKVSSVIREGDPRLEIAREAKRFKATCLFVGNRGLGAVGRVLLGSVSSHLAEYAPCTVEVDR